MEVSEPGKNFDLTPQACIRLLIDQRRQWLVPIGVCAVIALVYAIFMTRYWEAYQAMVVRDEASVSSSKQPGKFADLYEMRTLQETILELAKSPHVVTETMKNVALAETGEAPPEPDAEQIEQFRKRLSMTPPNGAEFGKTEVFYFSVKDPNRERALKLVDELCKQLTIRLGQLRHDRSAGLTSEFEKQVELAETVHQAENSKLKDFESQVGADLGELRLLHSASGGQSDLRQQMIDLEKESRAAEARLSEAEDLLAVLQAAQDDPARLVAMPSSLLKIQPTLQRLKNGLVDAQIQVSKLGGTRTAEHPHVKSAIEAVEHIRAELHEELAVVIEGLQVDIGLSHNRLDVLNSQIDDLKARLGRLAELRAEYSSRVANVENTRSVLSMARKQLSEVRAREVAAQGAQLVTPIDKPQTGPYQVGLGRTTVVLLGAVAGLVIGLGWLFLNLPAENTAPAPNLEIKPTPQTAPVPRTVPASISQPAFDFSGYKKKLREAGVLKSDDSSPPRPANAPTVAINLNLRESSSALNPPSLTTQ